MERRLRIKNTFGKREVETGSRNPKSAYVISIASEGKTEEQYFDGLAGRISSNIIKIDRLEKSDDYNRHSHPNHIIKLLDERMSYWDQYGIEANELWMVIDRDQQNVSQSQLENIIMQCQKKGYNLAISNPAFEFWLLLHLINIEVYDKKSLLENRKVRKKAKKRFINVELTNLLQGYRKKNIRFEDFEQGIRQAIDQAKKLPTDNRKLINELGTSVCLLVEKLVQK